MIVLLQGWLQQLRIMRSTKKRISILNGLSGTIQPGRLTLLLGPPSSGKTTLLKALSGKLRGSGLKVCLPQAPAGFACVGLIMWSSLTAGCAWESLAQSF